MFYETVGRSFEVIGGTETREIDEVNGAWQRELVERESEDYETKECENSEEIVVVLEMMIKPLVIEVFSLGDLD